MVGRPIIIHARSHRPAYPVPPARQGSLTSASLHVRIVRTQATNLPPTRVRAGLPWSRPAAFLLTSPGRAQDYEKSRHRTAYPQQIVTTRLLYCLQDRYAQLSRLQRI